MTTYAFDNAEDLAVDQLASLQTCLDPITLANLDRLDVGPGWRCLEVGAGAGSIARALAERVAPTGSVVATDIKPHLLDGPFEVLAHDITTDPLPAESFGLIHSRLVLLHLPAREQVLAKLVRALKPGGWLLFEEFDCTWLPVLSAPDEEAAALFTRVNAAMLALLKAAGADLAWGSRIYGALGRHGLVDINATAHAEPWRSGSPGARLHEINSWQLESRLVGTGQVTAEDLAGFRRVLADPRFAVSSYLTVSAWGRKPAA
ncbi:methyltransferase [Longispora fulva]|uniref:SAM-dependent methyltransferase n=1 Tax=Longispora fulva TaxID=619741 RepID=A0A8J7G784_9ACTN|nr:methyltransferase domain-containing protein [Longispora fulva]MBG6134155.1 SAM-dependent methyltransferase [Longispora fulva]GIG62528.1 methyltransferase [Longispora fulva]